MNPQIVTDCDSYLPQIAPLKVHIPTEADIFGTGSQLMTGDVGALREVVYDSWMASYVYQGMVFLLFGVFLYLLYSYRNSLGELVRMLVLRSASDNIEEEQNLLFSRFLNYTVIFGILFAATLQLRLADFWGVDHLLVEPFSQWRVEWFVGISLAIPAVVVAYRYLAMEIVAGVTQNHSFFRDYRFLSRLCGALSLLILTPIFLIFALRDGSTYTGVIYLMVIVLWLLYGYYLVRSFRFFMRRNVSILQWILYLCTIELFPVSFLLFAALRLA